MFNIITQKFKLVKECFPETWLRKWLLLCPCILLADCIFEKEKIVGLSASFFRTTLLLCVNSKHRKKGIATKLIARGKISWTLVLFSNKAALNFWKKRGFEIEKTFNIPFYDKYFLIKRKRRKWATATPY